MGKHKKAMEFDRLLDTLKQVKTVDGQSEMMVDSAEDIDSLAQLAFALKSLSPDDVSLASIKDRSRQRFLANAEQAYTQSSGIFSKANKRTYWRRLSVVQRTVLVAMMLLFCLASIGGGVVHASSTSLPGDRLYTIKLAYEDTQRFFIRNAEKRYLLEERLSQQRLTEVYSVLEDNRQLAVRFGGILYDMQPNLWIIDSLLVQIPSHLTIDGQPSVGCYVEVDAITKKPWEIVATAITVQGIKIQGVVSAINEKSLFVDDVEIVLGQHVNINPEVKVGDMVSIHTRNLSNGDRMAQDIEPGNQATSEHRRLEIHGLIETKNDNQWQIDGYPVAITAQTHLEEKFNIGDEINVLAVYTHNGQILAVTITTASDGHETLLLDIDDTKGEQDTESESSEEGELNMEIREEEDNSLDDDEGKSTESENTEQDHPENDSVPPSSDDGADTEGDKVTETEEHDDNAGINDEEPDDELDSDPPDESEDEEHEDSDDSD